MPSATKRHSPTLRAVSVAQPTYRHVHSHVPVHSLYEQKSGRGNGCINWILYVALTTTDATKIRKSRKGQIVWKKIQEQHLVELGSSVRSPQFPHGTKFRLADYSCGSCQRSTAVCGNMLDCVQSHTGLTPQQPCSFCTKCSSTGHTTRLTRATATVSLQQSKFRPNRLQRQHF